MHTKTTTILALAASLALAATDEEQPARRRLRDTVDLTRVHEKAEAKALTGALSFKLDAAAAAEHGDALAHRVADLIACSKAERTFRHSGIHEAKHVAKGLHLWYSVKCADGEGTVVDGLDIDDFSRGKMNITATELEDELSLALSLLG